MEEYIQNGPNNTSKVTQGKGNMLCFTIMFLFCDCQSNGKNLCEKFHKKINNSEETEKHTPKWTEAEEAML